MVICAWYSRDWTSQELRWTWSFRRYTFRTYNIMRWGEDRGRYMMPYRIRIPLGKIVYSFATRLSMCMYSTTMSMRDWASTAVLVHFLVLSIPPSLMIPFRRRYSECQAMRLGLYGCLCRRSNRGRAGAQKVPLSLIVRLKLAMRVLLWEV